MCPNQIELEYQNMCIIHNFPARKNIILMIHMAIDGRTRKQIRCVIYICALQNTQFTIIQDNSKN